MISASLLLMIALQIGQADAPPPPEVAPEVLPPAVAVVDAPDAISAPQLDALLQQLGDDQYPKREAAQSQLEAMNEARIAAALPRIAAMYHATTDAEIRMRLRRFGDHCFERLVVPRYAELHQPGYLGIIPAAGILDDRGTAAVMVVNILPDGPAQAAGMRQNDVILAIDDKPLPPVKNGAPGSEQATRVIVEQFVRAIQQRPPGTQVRFTIQRDEKWMTIPLRLAAVPSQHQDPRTTEIRQAQAKMLRQQWWNEGLLKGQLHPDLPLPPPPPVTPPDPSLYFDDE
ncbi:MAG: PDZ domain-containing protein [Phycisphaerales bacterium]